MNTAKTIDYKNYKIQIVYDEDCESPREWDNLGTIYSNHRRYDPDGHSIDELGETMEEIKENLNSNYYYLPIYAYIHSGIALSTSNTSYPFNDRWDSGLFGFIAVSKEDAEKEGIDTEKITEYLEGEIKTLNCYYQGEVYGYIVEDEDENEVDSCWNFIGDMDYAIEEAKSVIDTINQ